MNHLLDDKSAVICSDTAHIKVHEEFSHKFFIGYEYVIIPTDDGKIGLENLKNIYSQNKYLNPKVISITNPTEYGTVYTVEEIKNITEFAHKNNMLVHMDGARLSNASVSLGLNLKSISFDAGIDMLFFGGIKNGLMYGESVIFKDKNLSKDFGDKYEILLQCGSKMRFLSIQFNKYLRENIRYENAYHSNQMAKALELKISQFPQIKITQKVQTNGVWCIIPNEIIDKIQERFPIYIWNKSIGEVRLMCSFDTTEDDINGFISYLGKLFYN